MTESKPESFPPKDILSPEDVKGQMVPHMWLLKHKVRPVTFDDKTSELMIADEGEIRSRRLLQMNYNHRTMMEVECNEDGFFDGVQKSYYSNGALFSLGRWDGKGHKIGFWTYFDVKGNPIRYEEQRPMALAA